jgi:hypothetical protein
MSARNFLSIPILIVFFSLLSSCAPAATSTPEKITQPGMVERTQAPAEPASTEAPAAEEATRIPATSPIEQPSLPALPTSTPAPTLTPSILYSPTPSTLETPFIEKRIVEIEWPPRIRLGESDVIRLSLIPSLDGYTITTEYPEHQTITQTVNLTRPGGYELFAIARMDGVGFNYSPHGDQVQYVPPGEPLHWRWSLKPETSGLQRISIILKLRWRPLKGDLAGIREVAVYTTSLDVQVISFFGLTQAQALLTGLVGLFFSSGLGLVALAGRPRTHQRYPRPLTQIPNLDLSIELPPGVDISPQERSLLQALFNRYARLVIEQEFLSGYSGARTFLVLPVRADGRADAYTIAKLGERTAIGREYENYETYVKDTLPPITARIQHPPVTTSTPAPQGPKQAAIQYTFIAEPGSTPVSLCQALLSNPEPALLYKLFETFGSNWWLQHKPYTFKLAFEYDRVLPTHLVLEPYQGSGEIIDGRTSPMQLSYKIGDVLTMQNLVVEELRVDGRSVSLIGHPPSGQPPLRVRWLSLEPPERATGRVVATRQDLLRQYTTGCDLFDLPDPFERLPKFLQETIAGSQSIIHGDLNLENVLLGPGGLVWLIDFAQTRDGHTLYDFAHLEAEIIAHIMAPHITSTQEYLDILRDPYNSQFSSLYSLRDAMQKIASRCLFNPSQPREYLLASALACLGALKFTNLDQHAKHLLYLSAAYTLREL